MIMFCRNRIDESCFFCRPIFELLYISQESNDSCGIT